MEQFIGCDAHKRFSIFATLDETGEYGPTRRVGHGREEFRAFLQGLSPGSQIALETSGCYYWMVDEMEEAGHIPLLAHALTVNRVARGASPLTVQAMSTSLIRRATASTSIRRRGR